MAIKKIEVGMPAAQVQAIIAAIIDYQLGAGTSNAITNWSNLTDLLNEAAAEAQVSGVANNDPGFTVRARINDMIDACGIPEGAGWMVDYTALKYHNATDTFARSGPRWLTVGQNEVIEIESGAMAYVPDRGVGIGSSNTRISLYPLDFSGWDSVNSITTTLPAMGSFPTPERVESTGSAEDRIEVGIDLATLPTIPASLQLRLRARYRIGTSGTARFEIRSGASTVATLIGPGGALVPTDSDDIQIGAVFNTPISGDVYEVEVFFSVLNDIPGADFRIGFGPGSEVAGRYSDIIAAVVDVGTPGADWIFGAQDAAVGVPSDQLEIRTASAASPKGWLVHRLTEDGVVKAVAAQFGAVHNYRQLFGAETSLVQKVWGIEKLFATIEVGESAEEPIYRGVGPDAGSYISGLLAEGVAEPAQIQEYATAQDGQPKGIKVTVSRPSTVSAGDWPEILGQLSNLVLANTVTSLPILEGYEWVVTGSEAVAWFQTTSASGEFTLPGAGNRLYLYLD